MTNIVKICDKAKWVYSGYGIAFDGEGSWIFGNVFARNVVMFCVDSSSPYDSDNRTKNFSFRCETFL